MKGLNPAFAALYKNAHRQVKEITISEVKQLMDNNCLLLFLDVREESEWNLERLPFAKHLSRGVIERDIETYVPDVTTPMILYCEEDYRSVLAAESLQKMGYQNVLSMSGGYQAWCEAGYPIVID